jgi:4-alpha-glucanotransferase
MTIFTASMSRTRIAGVVLPLFSLRSHRDWGIGQISDLPKAAAWIRTAGHTLLQVLPPYELSDGETSPYGARTAFGLDPIYLDMDAIADLDSKSISEALGPEGRAAIEHLRKQVRVNYKDVRALKTRVLKKAFARFLEREWAQRTPRAQRLQRFIEGEREWLDDLSLYVALLEVHGGWGWETWPEPLRDRHEDALRLARETHAERILEYQYTAWLTLEQWDLARSEMRKLGVKLMGDLPFVVCNESADVWSHRRQFRREVSLGAPPDGFSPDGQDWGLPPYHWAEMDKDGLGWIQRRTRHAARLYDCFRLDHVIGYFRMYVREPGKLGTFDPEGAEAQRHRGERVLRTILEAAGDSRVIGEDLGVIPPFARETLNALGIPGYRVLPWERGDDHQLRNPRHFPEGSVATWSTHDTAPITQWWWDLRPDERSDFAALTHIPHDSSEHQCMESLLKLLMDSSSAMTLVLVQEILGEKTRINTPGTVCHDNWTYRLPKAVEELELDGNVMPRMARLRDLAVASARTES